MSATMIPYGRQMIGDEEIAAVVEVLQGDWLTCGPSIHEFEQALAATCGAKHAIAVSNGTAALHVAMLAAEIGAGDRVLTSANTFLASANCVEYVGGIADFADIDPATNCVSAATLAAAWQRDVKAIIPVDFAGYPCVDRAMADAAHGRGALVIEDASHALGSARDGYRVGNLPWADMTTFSFHPVKTITTGEGGAIVTNDDRLAERCRRLRNHGMDRSPAVMDAVGPWYYEMHEVGYNYRITDLQCALGSVQLRRLDEFVDRRQDIVAQYDAAFKALPQSGRAQGRVGDDVQVAWHLYALQLNFEALAQTRVQFMQQLRDAGVASQVHYYPVHLQPYYQNKYGYAAGKCPAAEAYYTGALSLPLFPGMKASDVNTVIAAVNAIVAASAHE